MKHQKLIKGKVYINTLDKDIPLMFTGRKEERNQFNSINTIAFFKPVKTDRNKNWYNDIKIIQKSFDNKIGNQYITIGKKL